jgi:hypothetical protein
MVPPDASLARDLPLSGLPNTVVGAPDGSAAATPLLHECQNGFMPKRRCADHQVVLYQTLTSRQQAKQDSYVLFIDTYKSFPTVWLDGLFHKLCQEAP